MNVKIKKLHDDAVIPEYSRPGDAGLDLTATEIEKLDFGNKIIAKTGLSIEIPPGFVGLLFPRSSVYKQDISLANSVGVIDSGYRGEIMFVFTKNKFTAEGYEVGDRVGQIILMRYPQITFEEVEELSATERDEGGFGSTGK